MTKFKRVTGTSQDKFWCFDLLNAQIKKKLVFLKEKKWDTSINTGKFFHRASSAIPETP